MKLTELKILRRDSKESVIAGWDFSEEAGYTSMYLAVRVGSRSRVMIECKMHDIERDGLYNVA